MLNEDLSGKQAIVVFSGGQDSTTVLAYAIQKHGLKNVECITFDYAQRHQIELKQANKIADIVGVPIQILSVDLFEKLTKNALTDPNQKIEHSDGELPSTFVPGRNHIFLSIAAIAAYQKNIEHIYTGVCQTDYSGYPDCRDNFVKSLEQTLNLAMSTSITLHTPLMWLTKAQTIHLMEALGKTEWYKESHTCYEGLRPACGQCPACKLRLNGFAIAGVKDPLDYLILENR